MNALTLTWKDLRVFVRDRGAVFMLFLLPFAFIVVLSLAGQGIKLEQSGPEGLPLTVVNGDPQGQAARDFVAALNDHGAGCQRRHQGLVPGEDPDLSLGGPSNEEFRRPRPDDRLR